jgi:hypothetical protein
MIELPHLNTATKGGRRDMIEILKSIVGHAAFLPVFSALMTLVITSIFDLKKRQALGKQMFFDRFFPERIKAYNDILEIMISIINALSKVHSKEPSSRPEALQEIVIKMQIDFYKQQIWLGREIKDLLNKMIVVISEPIINKDKYRLVESINNEELAIILSSFMNLNNFLNEQIELSSGIKLIDNKYHQLTKPPFWQNLF